MNMILNQLSKTDVNQLSRLKANETLARKIIADLEGAFNIKTSYERDENHHASFKILNPRWENSTFATLEVTPQKLSFKFSLGSDSHAAAWFYMGLSSTPFASIRRTVETLTRMTGPSNDEHTRRAVAQIQETIVEAAEKRDLKLETDFKQTDITRQMHEVAFSFAIFENELKAAAETMLKVLLGKGATMRLDAVPDLETKPKATRAKRAKAETVPEQDAA